MNRMLLASISLYILIEACQTKEIFLSQSSISSDGKLCGGVINPCRTMRHLLSIITNGDIVNIDGGSIPASRYTYTMPNHRFFNGTYVFRKWERKTSNQTSIMIPIITSSRFATRFATRIQCVISKLTFHSIVFHKVHIEADMEKNCYQLHIIRCVFKRIISKRSSIQYVVNINKYNNNKYYYYNRNFYGLQIHHSRLHLELIVRSPRRIYRKILYRKRLWSTQAFLNIPLTSSSILQIAFSNINIQIFNSTIAGSVIKGIVFAPLSIHNCTFQNAIINISCVKCGRSFLTLSHSTFKVGKMIIENKPIKVVESSFDNFTVEITGRKIKAYISGTIFQNTMATSEASALSIVGELAEVKLTGCLFRNNTSIADNLVSSLTINHRKDYAKAAAIKLLNTTFHGMNKDSIESRIIDENVVFTNTKVICPFGKYVRYSLFGHPNSEKMSLITKCVYCYEGSYAFEQKNAITKDKFKETDSNKSCMRCPYKAICEEGRMVLKGGYWGFITKIKNSNNKRISLLTCPPYYCCSSKETCTSYNTCGSSRTGRLCSECISGFSCGIAKRYQCTANSQCNNGIITFAIYTVLAIVLALTLMYIKEIVIFIKSKFKPKSTSCNNGISSGYSEHEDEGMLTLRERLIHESTTPGDRRTLLPFQILDEPTDVPTDNYREQTFLMSGSLKIFFFFYQAAELIRISSIDKIELIFPKFFDFLFTIFNVRIDVTYSNISLCILPGMNVLQAKMVRIAFVLITITVIVFFGMISYLCSEWKTKQIIDDENMVANATDYQHISDNVPTYCYLPFIVRVKCVYVQFLLISFASISTFCFDAIYCIDIDGEPYLYTQASIKCYQVWQYGVISFIVFWIVPFPLFLYIAPKLLYKCLITPTQFLMIFSFPPILLYFVFARRTFSFEKRVKFTADEAKLAKHLLMVVNEPFRKSIADNSNICWEAVLILRKILLVIAQTFIMAPLTRLYFMVILLLGYALHHHKMKPFTDSVLNDVEFYSLHVLISLAVANMFWAFTREFGIMKNPLFTVLGESLMFYEVFLLSLPFLLLILYIVYRLCTMMHSFCKRVIDRLRHKQD